MTWIVDSSALITLARAAATDLLRLLSAPVLTVSEVYRETVETGIARGYADAAFIEAAFRDGVVSIRDPKRTARLPGVGATDSLVIHLAEEVRAEGCLINDHSLRLRALERGLNARYTVEYVQDLTRQGDISTARRDELVRDFVASGRYTPELVQAVLLGGEQWDQ